jgi:hypothetical protein
MRVRRNSPGLHSWVLAVTNSSGESFRMADSRSRRRAASKSGAGGGGVLVMRHDRWRTPTATGWAPGGGRR